MTESGINSHQIDRASASTIPPGRPAIYQSWGKLLFMHWPVPVESLRPLIPSQLEIDTFNGQAWLGVVPFTMWNIRPRFTPKVPVLSKAHELNVRTYVHYKGFPGVWFLSLEINQTLGNLIGRHIFYLPYHRATIKLDQNDQTIHYDLTRWSKSPSAKFTASWSIGEELPQTQPDSLEFFLTERYCLFAEHKSRIYRSRIWHQPWPLQQATVHEFRSTMAEANGLPSPTGEPLLHYAESLSVGIWPLLPVGI